MSEPRGWWRRRRSSLAIGGAAVLVAATVGYAWYGVDLTSDDTQAPRPAGPPATAVVTRQTLVETVKVSGTLGYGENTAVSARSGGTVTWLPAAGTIVERGQPVYRRDEVPVPLLYGTVPTYRVLASGVEGGDVRQLEDNLAALGYDGFTVDDAYTWDTAEAVRLWQGDLGAPQTGRVALDDVVVAPGPMRIAALVATVGAPASGPLLSYSDTTRVVTVDLDVAKQHLVSVGIPAVVTLPDGSTVDGEVSDVGTVASTSGGSGPGGAQGTTTTTIDVTVTVADQQALGALDAAPVTVTLEADRAEDVLTVPVAALVALAEGGYGVELIEGSTSHYVAVTTGMFAGGRVEISGSGVTEGTVVGMPA